MNLKKMAIKYILSFSAILMLSATVANAGTTEILKVDFEDISYQEFSELDAVTIKPGISSDELTIGEESPGNQAFKIHRAESEVIENTTPVGFNYKLPVTLTTGKVNVSFKIKAEKVFRSRWRDMGSAMTSTGGRKLFLFTFAQWAWAQSTGGGYWNSTISTPDVWYEVRYELDIDNASMVVGAGKVGTTIQTKEKTCSAGDFASLEFTIGKQHNSWTQLGNAGDIEYWIDDILVTVEGVNVLSTSVDGIEKEVPTDKALEITFDEVIPDEKVNPGVLSLKCGDDTANVIVDKKSDKVITIEPEGGFDYNKEYRLIVKMPELSSVMFANYEKSFKTVSIIDCDIEKGKRYNSGFIPQLNKRQGITYSGVYTVSGGAETEYNFGEALNLAGKYKLTVTATDEKGKSQVSEYEFEIISKVAPIIEGDVTISGEPITGTELTGVYKFLDENDDEQDLEKTVHKWFRIDKEGRKNQIAEKSNKYKLTAEDEDCYIQFTVIPYSKTEPYEGEEYKSELFIGAMNPTASEIKVSGDKTEGSTLAAEYKYYDENEDAEIREGEGKTVISWYSSTSKTEGFQKIGEGETYKLTEKENSRWLKVGIVPKNAGPGRQEDEFFSEVFAGAFAPVAENVKITGTVKAGNLVGVSYQFTDENGDAEEESLIKWYVGGNLVSEDESYTISSSDSGKDLYVTVTPKAKAAPFEGETVKSDVVKVAAKRTESYSSGGGGGGIGGGTAVTPPVSKPDPKPEEKKFTDVSGHWAEAEIIEMSKKGILNGKSDSTFAPDESVSRAELAAIIARTFGLNGTGNNFADVPGDAWFEGYVNAVYEKGYMSGYKGSFRPDDKITRQEIAVVLFNIAKDMGISASGENKSYSDSDNIPDWAKEAVEFSSAAGLMQGVDSESFKPEGNVSRAQAAVILSRITKIQ